ncbi:MAG: hypothetical protein IH975_07865 [Nitrospinae bacterium]|nr:hypothetical protein [Nitrospinota bacterium]
MNRAYRASLRASHPRGLYRRSGRAFTPEPVLLAEQEMTEAILNDPWLVVEEVEEQEGPTWATGARELREHIEGLEDGAAVQAVLDWESSTRRRRTVIRAAEKRLGELAALSVAEAAE